MNTPPVYTAEQYLVEDCPRSLFPLSATRVLVQHCSGKLKEYVYNKVLSSPAVVPGFTMQQRCHAAKTGFHLRRTFKLDPAAEFFIYDIVYRNRKSFRDDHRSDRRTFGYRFKGGLPRLGSEAHHEFRASLREARRAHSLTLKTDVATYFNSVYHHDLVGMVRDISWAEADVAALGQFLREINGGRSLDCLPQGLHPCKVLGSEFLRFVDHSHRVRSEVGVRFLDDIQLFASKPETLVGDLVALQELLGEKGLSLNEAKTALGEIKDVDIPQAVDRVKRGLLKIRQVVVAHASGAVTGYSLSTAQLSPEQIEYLLNLIENPDIDEADAELVLVLLREHEDRVLPKVFEVLGKYPGLTRNLYQYARVAQDREGTADLMVRFLKEGSNITEYQLFWLCKLAEDFLDETKKYGELLSLAFDHANATVVSRAKVLEIPGKRFGLPELREEALRSGRSDWESWAAAVGLRDDALASRNHVLKYFAKGSPLNALIADCVMSL